MARHHLREAIDNQLRKQDDNLEAFLTEGLRKGLSPTSIAAELKAATDIEVSFKSVYRWIEALGLKTSGGAK